MKRMSTGIPGCSDVWHGRPEAKPFSPQLDDVVAICDRIAHDIRNQYTIGYVSSNVAEKPGAFRTIRVTASSENGKLEVRARSGYIAGGEPSPPKHEARR